MQLSTSQYAPRLATEFVADKSYKVTVTVFGFSIGLNIAVLSLFGQFPEAILTLLLSASLMVAVGSFLTLYYFVANTLEKTTPEGILSHIEDRMNPKTMVSDIRKAAEDHTYPDPFLPLISIIHSFISKKDRTSASLGLEVLGNRVSSLLRFKKDQGIEHDSPVDNSLENLCGNQLPNTIEEAVDRDLTQVASTGSKTFKSIGEVAIQTKSDRALEHTVNGHIEIIDTLGYGSEKERIRSNIIDDSGDLLKLAAKDGLWNSAAIGTRRLGWISAASIMRRNADDGRNNHYSSLLVLQFPKTLKIATESYSTFQDHSVGEWKRLQMLDSHPAARLINSCYGSMAELTSAAIRYEIRTGQSILRWRSVAHGWSEGLEALDDTNLYSMKQLWLATLLYLEYIDHQTPDHVMDGFNPQGKHTVSEEIGTETVEQIKIGRLDPSGPIELRPGRADPVELPLTGVRVPIVEDVDETFEDWVSNRHFFFGRGLFGRRLNTSDQSM